MEEAVCMASTQAHAEIGVNVSPTLTNDKDRFPTVYPNKTGCLSCGDHPGGLNGQDALTMAPVIKVNRPNRKYIIRRLTPLECCRLQGFPDYWTDGVPGSDSAKYKMWGNGIALPCAVDVLMRIKNEINNGGIEK